MQVNRFETGGFVAHKVSPAESKLTFSIWCNSKGEILDVEAFRANGTRHNAFTMERLGGVVGEKLKLVGFQLAASLYPSG